MSRIHEYLPETLKDVIDLKLLNEDLDIELEQLDGYITGIGKEVIVKSASLYGIQKWEKALGITPKDGDSLETRRFRVNNLLTSKLPYTYRWLIQKLTQITGSPSGYTLNINQADYAITIVLSGLDTNMMIEVQKQLRNAIPSNMVLEIGGPPLVSADIKVGMALRIGTKYKIDSAYGNGDSSIPLGKNLLDSNNNLFQGTFPVANGGNNQVAHDAIKCCTKKIYIGALTGYLTFSGRYYDLMAFYDGDDALVEYSLTRTNAIPQNAKTVRIRFMNSNNPLDINTLKEEQLMLENSRTATEYEPFIGF